MNYQFFSPASHTVVSHGRLPHVEQPAVCYFITFRTADSLPRHVCTALAERRAAWQRSHGIEPDDSRGDAALARLSRHDRAAYSRSCARAWHDELDACHGSCPLRKPALRQHVVDALRHGDGMHYDLDAFVVMPNHVHVLAGFVVAGSMRPRCTAWKRFSATHIQRSLGCRGRFWQAESYDRVVRDRRSFEAWRLYIEGNPRKAGLREDEYTLYLRPEPIVGHE